MWFYYAIYFSLVIAFYIAIRYDKQNYVYIVCLLGLSLISGLRPSTCCADYLNYVDYYNDIDNRNIIQLEPTFFFISKTVKFIFNSSIGLFVIYAFLGIFLKGLAFKKLSRLYLLSLVIYSSTYFLRHEMTQIRVGIASAILLLSIPTIYEKDWVKFVLLLITGTMFHYSFLIFSFFYFLNTKTLNPVFYVGLLVTAYLAFFLKINVISILGAIPIEFISGKISAYSNLLEAGVDTKINVFNILIIFRICFISILIWKRNFLYKKNKYSIILIKIYAFSVFFFVFFFSLPVFAFRMNELIGVVEIILVPFIVYLLKEKYIAFIIVILTGLMFMSIDIWYNKMISTYF